MKIKILLGFFVFIGASGMSFVIAQGITAADKNEARQVHFAEQIIIGEMIHGLSLSTRRTRENILKTCNETREQCQSACPFPTYYALELAIGTIGIGRSEAAANALVNLLALRLDAAGSEGVGCQIATRGRSLLGRLERLDAKSLAEHCQLTFHKLRPKTISDVKVEQVCHTEEEILEIRNLWLDAFKSDVELECPY
jgi:hypothetical protein